jgi:hypothetical protein
MALKNPTCSAGFEHRGDFVSPRDTLFQKIFFQPLHSIKWQGLGRAVANDQNEDDGSAV